MPLVGQAAIPISPMTETDHIAGVLVALVELVTGETTLVEVLDRPPRLWVTTKLSAEGCRRVRGRQGRTYEALRRVTSAIGGRLNLDFRIRFEEAVQATSSGIHHEATASNTTEIGQDERPRRTYARP